MCASAALRAIPRAVSLAGAVLVVGREEAAEVDNIEYSLGSTPTFKGWIGSHPRRTVLLMQKVIPGYLETEGRLDGKKGSCCYAMILASGD